MLSFFLLGPWRAQKDPSSPVSVGLLQLSPPWESSFLPTADTKPWEDLVRLLPMYIPAIAASEIPTVLAEVSLNGFHFGLVDIFWNKVR